MKPFRFFYIVTHHYFITTVPLLFIVRVSDARKTRLIRGFPPPPSSLLLNILYTLYPSFIIDPRLHVCMYVCYLISIIPKLDHLFYSSRVFFFFFGSFLVSPNFKSYEVS